jgi:hypothetical protein
LKQGRKPRNKGGWREGAVRTARGVERAARGVTSAERPDYSEKDG